MARDKCTLTDAELIEKARDWISKLAKSGGREWCLHVPVDFNHDPDMIFSELCKRLEGAKNTEQQLQPDNSCEHSFSPVYQCVHCGKIGDSIA